MPFKSFSALIFAKYIVFKNSFWKKNAIEIQRKTLLSLVSSAKHTSFGKDHNFNQIKSYDDWKRNVPIRDYEALLKYIKRLISGEKNVLWPGRPIYFCKTSGTTSGTKYIPISKESMSHHIISARDAILSYIAESKNANIVDGKMIFLQGSPKLKKTGSVLTGRLSGIVAHHVPKYLLKNRLPSYDTNCIDNWEEKINSIVNETISENMTLIGGIPPWVQMYFEKLIEKTNSSVGDLFPNLSVYMYGGVNFEPYKNSFKALINKKITGIELYPASEGFIAYQDSQKEMGMTLCVNNNIFYEFIAVSDFNNGAGKRVWLKDVSLDTNYVIILNTNAGLWGYNIGDTVKFVSINPYKIIVTGRIKHFTSAFGEHVIAEEVESSLKEALSIMSAEIKEFHVAPQVNPKSGLPFHEWFIEFERTPSCLDEFALLLDNNLQKRNVYYKDLITDGILRHLKISCVKKNGFINYMKSVGKLGGQNKTPRLANDRLIANQLTILKND